MCAMALNCIFVLFPFLNCIVFDSRASTDVKAQGVSIQFQRNFALKRSIFANQICVFYHACCFQNSG